MKNALLGLCLLGLLACQKTSNSPVANKAQLGGTSSGGPMAVIDLIHCHTHGKQTIVDVFMGQGLRLATKWNWPQNDANDFVMITNSAGANGFQSYETAVEVNGVITQLNMVLNDSTQMMLDTHWVSQQRDKPIRHIPAILDADGKSQSMSCTMYPEWASQLTCPEQWHSIEYLPADPGLSPPEPQNLCVPDEASSSKPQ